MGYLYTPKSSHQCTLPFPGREKDGTVWQCDEISCKKIYKMKITKTYGAWIEITQAEANELFRQMGKDHMSQPK